MPAYQGWQLAVGLGKRKARMLSESLAHWHGHTLRAVWGAWRSHLQEAAQSLARAEAHWTRQRR